MIRQFNLRAAFWFVITLFLVSSITAIAAGNSVPSTRLARQTQAVTANTLKPAACSALSLTNIVICPSAGGTCAGTSANDLILGSANNDTISGAGGDDCILGGDGKDKFDGGAGNDVCIGGLGNDKVFKNCETQL